MKTKFFLPIAAVVAMAAMTGCDENSWNKEYLDGFDSNITPEQKETVDYTLTNNDYKAISSNSENKALAESQDASAELASLGTKFCFNEKITAREYIPAYLNSSSSPFFTLTDGSAIKMTYKVQNGLPESVYDAAAAHLYTVSEDDYMEAWGSEDNYIDAYAPSHPASKSIPAILKDYYDDAEPGEYAIVSYNEASQEPVFGNVGGGDNPTPPPFELSNVIANIAPGDDVDINGVVTGSCTSGFTLTDASATIFVYMGSGFDEKTYAVGTQVHLVGSATSFKDNLQIATGAEIEVVGSQEYTYPTPQVYDAATLDAVLSRPANVPAIYCTMTGKVAVSGNNINIVLSDEATAKGSIYYATESQKAALEDGSTVTVTGWFISISGGKYCNVVVTSIAQGAAKARGRRVIKAPAVEVPVQQVNAVYKYEGGKWSVPADFSVLSPADYTAMGRRSDLTPALAKEYLPKYLASKLPYATSGAERYVLYLCYANGATAYACDMYTFDGSKWNLFDGVVDETSQFVRSQGKWMYDPNVTITLPAGKGQELSTLYYQACVDWVYENICVPLGDTSIKSGKFYVTSYGNNEYYSGTSAYQGNVDLRAGSARSQYPAGWEGYTDEQIVETEKRRFTHEVLPAVLSKLNAEAAPVPGLDVYYTINFSAYDGAATTPYVVKYKVTAPATFEFVECSWYPDGKPAE